MNLVLTDVQMPDTDGFGLLRLLRNSDIGSSRTVPVAVMTARGDGKIPEIYAKKKDLQAVFINRSISTDCLPFLSTIVSRTQVSVSGDFEFFQFTGEYG